jgi:hypothetical protein
VIRRRAFVCAVLPAAVALAGSAVTALGTLRLTHALGDGAVSIPEAAQAVPHVAPEPAAVDDDPVDYDTVERRIVDDDLLGRLDDGQRAELRLLLAEVVRGAVQRAREQPADVRVQWIRERTTRGERVVDVVTEGTSLVRNYRVQIRKILLDPAKGYPFLVERLRRKIARSS